MCGPHVEQPINLTQGFDSLLFFLVGQNVIALKLEVKHYTAIDLSNLNNL